MFTHDGPFTKLYIIYKTSDVKIRRVSRGVIGSTIRFYQALTLLFVLLLAIAIGFGQLKPYENPLKQFYDYFPGSTRPTDFECHTDHEYYYRYGGEAAYCYKQTESARVSVSLIDGFVTWTGLTNSSVLVGDLIRNYGPPNSCDYVNKNYRLTWSWMRAYVESCNDMFETPRYIAVFLVR